MGRASGKATTARRRASLGAVIAAVALAGCVSGAPGPPTTSPPGSATTAAPSTTAAPVSCRATGERALTDVIYRRVDGVDPALLSLDAYVPERPAGCGAGPIVVYVHGGGFVTGDKANKIADKVRLFTSEGWTFVSVDYRLSSRSTASDARPVRYPIHEDDVAAAIGWIDRHAADVGGDPSRIFLVGHSSGAFIVSLLSTDRSFLTDAGVDADHVRCTVSLDTEYDVARQVAQGGAQERLYRNAMGDDPTTWATASPIQHTAAGITRPQFMVVTQGPGRRTGQARDFVEALRAGGTDASFLDLTPLTHEQVNDAVGAPGDAVLTPTILSFLRGCR